MILVQVIKEQPQLVKDSKELMAQSLVLSWIQSQNQHHNVYPEFHAMRLKHIVYHQSLSHQIIPVKLIYKDVFLTERIIVQMEIVQHILGHKINAIL